MQYLDGGDGDWRRALLAVMPERKMVNSLEMVEKKATEANDETEAVESEHGEDADETCSK